MSSVGTGTGWAAPPPAGDREPAPAEQPRTASVRRSRRARLVLSRLDPWSVMKLSALLSVAIAVVVLIAVLVVWYVLDTLGVFTSLSNTISDVTQSENSDGFDLMKYVGLQQVLTVTAILVAINAVLMTALATLGAFLYNLSASLVGGLQVTLSEDA